jgi:hypothetical protein
MTFTDTLERWFDRRRLAVSDLPEWSFKRFNTGGPKPSAELAADAVDKGFDALVWDSGEVEMIVRIGAWTVDRHFDLGHPRELEDLLESTLAEVLAGMPDMGHG